MSTRSTTASCGFGLGSVLAAWMSWVVNKSIVWVVIHIFCGWLYVFYAACQYTEQIDAAAMRLAGEEPGAKSSGSSEEPSK